MTDPTRFKVRTRFEELVFGLTSELPDERKLCLTWLAQMGTPEVLPHIEKLTSDPVPSVCSLARQFAGELRERMHLVRDPDWSQDPIALLAHEDHRARLTGAMMLYEKEGPEYRAALLERLEVEEHPFVRASLVKALRHYREPEIIERLSECLLDPDPRIRSNTIEALLEFDHPGLFNRISHLLHDPDTRVKGTVLIYLARRKPDKIRPLLEKMIASEDSWAQRAARHAFRSLGWEVPEGPTRSDAAREVAQMFQDQDFQIRIQAVWRALTLDREERSGLLRDQLAREEHPHVIATLTRALGAPGMTEHLSLLSRYLDSDDPRIRANTIEGIASIGGPAALSLIEGMQEDPNVRVRSTALAVIGRVKRKRAIDVLRPLLDSDRPEELVTGLHALTQLQEVEADRVLEVLSRAWDRERKQLVRFLLEQLAQRAPAPWVARGLAALTREEGVTQETGPRRDETHRPGTTSRHRAEADLGALVVRLREAEEIALEAFDPAIAELRSLEDAIAQGILIQENLHQRHRKLGEIGKLAVALVEEGQVLVPRVVRMVEAMAPGRRAPGTPESGSPAARIAGEQAENPPVALAGQGAWAPGTGPVAAAAGTAPGGSTRPVIDPWDDGTGGGVAEPAGPRKPMVALGVLVALGMAVGAARTFRRPPAGTPAPIQASPVLTDPSAATPAPMDRDPASLPLGQPATWTGTVVEIRDEGQNMVLDDDGTRRAIVLSDSPAMAPRIGDILRVSGTVTRRSGAGDVHLEVLNLEKIGRSPFH